MTTRELNDFLTLTGPGTPMGDAVPPLLDSGADVVRAAGAGLPAGARASFCRSG